MFHGGWSLKQCFKLLDVDALHQVLVVANTMACAQGLAGVAQGQRCNVEESLHLQGQCGQHGLEVDREHGEGFDADGANVLQPGVHAFFFCQFPRLVGVHVFVYAVRQHHGFAQRLGVFAGFVQLLNTDALNPQLAQQRRPIGRNIAQQTVKSLGNKTCRARRDVDVFANQITVDPHHEIFRAELHVFIARVQLGGNVVAQPFGVHAQAEVFERIQPGATALAHLFAVDRQKTMDKHRIGHLAAAEVQHGRPEQGMKRDDVLANEMVLLGGRVGHESVIALRPQLGVASQFDKVVFK